MTTSFVDAAGSNDELCKIAQFEFDEEQIRSLRDMMVVIGAMEAITPGMRAKAADFRCWFELGLGVAEMRECATHQEPEGI